MKNKFLIVAAFFGIAAANAQSRKVEIPTQKQLLEYQFLDNGGFYLQFGKITAMMEGPRLEKNMVVYSDKLEKTEDRDLSDIKLKAEGFVTPDGKLTGFKNQAFTAMSDEKIYYFFGSTFKTVKEQENKGLLKDIIKVMQTDKYSVYFGKKAKRKDKAILSGEEATDLFFNRRNIATLETKLVPIQFPLQSFPGGKVFYQYQSHTNEKAYFLLNILQDNGKKNNCALVSFDWDGKLIDNIPFVMALDSGKDFTFFNNAEANIVETVKGGNYTQQRTDAATVNAKIAKDGFYMMGVSGDLKKTQIFGTGFYLHKYDFTGKLLWKIEKELDNTDKSKKSKSNYYIGEFDLHPIDNGKIAVWAHQSNSDNNVFYEVKGATGDILSEKNAAVFYKSELEWSRKLAFAGLQKAIAITGEKGADKNRVDFATIYAMLYRPEVQQYISGRQGCKFEARLFENGVYLIEENGKENVVRLMKFE